MTKNGMTKTAPVRHHRRPFINKRRQKKDFPKIPKIQGMYKHPNQVKRVIETLKARGLTYAINVMPHYDSPVYNVFRKTAEEMRKLQRDRTPVEVIPANEVANEPRKKLVIQEPAVVPLYLNLQVNKKIDFIELQRCSR